MLVTALCAGWWYPELYKYFASALQPQGLLSFRIWRKGVAVYLRLTLDWQQSSRLTCLSARVKSKIPLKFLVKFIYSIID